MFTIQFTPQKNILRNHYKV